MFPVRHLSAALAALLVLIPSTAAWAQPEERRSSAVRVQVLDGQQLPIPGALVILRPEGAGLERTATTGLDGVATIERPGTGPFALLVTAGGFSPGTGRVVNPAELAVVALVPARFDEVVTVQSAGRQAELRDSLHTTVNVVDRASVLDPGGSSAGEALRGIPGVVTRRGSEGTGAAGQQVQGIDSRQVLVLIDGQPVASARGIKSGLVNLDRYSLAPLDRIEVVKGASSALYGSDAIGGVVNLITRDAGRGTNASLSLFGGTLGLADIAGDVGSRGEGWSVFGLAGRRQRDDFDLTPTTFDTTGASFGRTNGFAKATWQTSALTLTGSGDGYRNVQDARAAGELGPQDSHTTETAWSAGARADWQVAQTTVLQFRGHGASYHETLDSQLLTGTPLDPGMLDEQLLKVDATLSHVAERHHLQTGIELQHDDYSGINRLRTPEGQDATMLTWWAQDKIAFGARTLITAGVRVDRHDAFGTAVSPKVGLNVRAVEGVRLRASYGEGFRAPDLGQLYYRFLNPSNFYQVIGNPALDAESSRSVQAGVELSPRRSSARLGASYFWNDVDNLIESVSLGFVATQAQLDALLAREGIDPSFKPQPGRLLFHYRNVAHARTDGVELDGDWRPMPSLQVAGAYTYLRARDLERDVTLTGRHPHQGHVRMAWSPTTRITTSVQGSLFSSWIVSRTTSTTGVTETMGEQFALWDVSATGRLTRGLSVTAAVLNLTDSVDPNTGQTAATGAPLPIYRPEYGRVFRVGLTLQMGDR